MLKSIIDLKENLNYNRERWGSYDQWVQKDQFGYKWGGGVQQTTGGWAKFADEFLRPHTGGRYDHKILELAPGAGRFTAECIRYASKIDLLDMNQACLDICRKRFRYYPLEIGYFLNDGMSCDILGDRTYTLIVCCDSMVHMHPRIIEGYVTQFSVRLSIEGIMWLDHSGKGPRELGHRTDMTPEKMARYGLACGLRLVEQRFRNDHDCITVFRRVE